MINYKESVITFDPMSRAKVACAVISNKQITLKGFLDKEITLLPLSEAKGYIHTEALTGDSEFELKGLVSLSNDKGILVHNRIKVTADITGYNGLSENS